MECSEVVFVHIIHFIIPRICSSPIWRSLQTLGSVCHLLPLFLQLDKSYGSQLIIAFIAPKERDLGQLFIGRAPDVRHNETAP